MELARPLKAFRQVWCQRPALEDGEAGLDLEEHPVRRPAVVPLDFAGRPERVNDFETLTALNCFRRTVPLRVPVG